MIDVPPENSKTGRYYKISAPVARYLEGMRKVSQHKKPDDFLFYNQQTAQPFSERISKDNLAEVLVESCLGDWGEDDSNNFAKLIFIQVKTLPGIALDMAISRCNSRRAFQFL